MASWVEPFTIYWVEVGAASDTNTHVCISEAVFVPGPSRLCSVALETPSCEATEQGPDFPDGAGGSLLWLWADRARASLLGLWPGRASPLPERWGPSLQCRKVYALAMGKPGEGPALRMDSFCCLSGISWRPEAACDCTSPILSTSVPGTALEFQSLTSFLSFLHQRTGRTLGQLSKAWRTSTSWLKSCRKT